MKLRPWFIILVALSALGLLAAPQLILTAPREETMGFVQKIFYYHVPAWMAMYSAIAVCTVASAIYLFQSKPAADRFAVSSAEIAVLFGLMGLVTGPLWGRKAWGVWWQWDARLTSALLMELIFVAYLLVRKYGGPGSEKLAAATALFGGATAPFVYKSVDIWRTIHPKTSVVPTLGKDMGLPFAFCSIAFVLLFVVLLTLRVDLAARQAALDELYLAQED